MLNLYIYKNIIWWKRNLIVGISLQRHKSFNNLATFNIKMPCSGVWVKSGWQEGEWDTHIATPFHPDTESRANLDGDTHTVGRKPKWTTWRATRFIAVGFSATPKGGNGVSDGGGVGYTQKRFRTLLLELNLVSCFFCCCLSPSPCILPLPLCIYTISISHLWGGPQRVRFMALLMLIRFYWMKRPSTYVQMGINIDQ